MNRLTRWTAFFTGLLMAALPLCGAGEEIIELVLKPDPADISPINGGVFEGWGTSLCWWANRIGYSDSLSLRAAEAFCDPDRGAGAEEGCLGRRDTGMVQLTGGYWGTAVADHDRQELILTMKYYVLGQYTRMIRPGSRLIAMSGPAVAALDADEKALTLVVLNQESTDQRLWIDLSAFGSTFPAGCPVRAVRTSGSIAQGEHWAELPPLLTEYSGLSAVLAPFSVTTFRIQGN